MQDIVKKELDHLPKSESSKVKQWVWMGIRLLLIAIGLCFGFGVFMYVIDLLMPCFRGVPHNRSGDVWFSVLGCFLPAVPSIILSVVAIRQTERINMLDKKMHRPALAFQSAELVAWYMNMEGNEDSRFYKEMPIQQQIAIRNYQREWSDNPECCVLKINLNMLLKNDVSIEIIEITSYKFHINKKEYNFNRNKAECVTKKFENMKHGFDNGIEIYSLQWLLLAFTPEREEIWREFNNAIRNNEFLNPCYDEFWLELEMKVKFGLDEERVEQLKAKIYFCSENNDDNAEDTVYRILSPNGRIMYC